MSDKATLSIERQIVSWLWARYENTHRATRRCVTVDDYIEDRPAERHVADIIEAHQRAAEALRAVLHAVCGETGFAEAVRKVSGYAYPWPALEIAEEAARAALAELDRVQR